MTSDHSLKAFFREIIILFFLAAGITVGVLFLSGIGYHKGLFTSYFSDPYLLGLNFLPVFLSLLMVWALTRSRRWTFFLGIFVWAFLSIGNTVKIAYRHEMLELYDAALWQDFIKILPRYLNAWILLGLAGLLVAVMLFFYWSRHLGRGYVPRQGHSFLLLGVIVLVAVGCRPPYMDEDLSFEMNEAAGLDRWTDLDRFMKNGYGYSLVANSIQSYKDVHRHYRKKEAAQLAKQYPGASMPAEQRVNMIVILLESYKDFSEGISFQKDPYRYTHQLQDKSYSGMMMPDTYGGGTLHAELQVLTGFNGDVNARIFNQPRESYVRALAEQGYWTEGIHPNDGYFYNRANFYPELGFRAFLYSQNYFHNDDVVDDETLFQMVWQRCCDHKKKKQPLFFYVATMGGHGPYHEMPMVHPPYVEVPAGPSGVALNNYFAKIESTGRALTQLTEALEKDDAPWVVVAFGDHSPGFNEDMYRYLGWAPEQLDERKKMATSYLFWSNQRAKDLTGISLIGQGPTLDPDFLMAEFFRQMHWPGPTTYLSFLQTYSCSVQVEKRYYCITQGELLQPPGDKLLALQDQRNTMEWATRDKKLKPLSIEHERTS